MHVPINVKSPNNISKWQMGFNSAFKGLRTRGIGPERARTPILFHSILHDRNRWRTLVNAVMTLRVPLNEENLLTSLEPDGFSRRTLLHGVKYK
jgi:hypothetical protein